MNQEVTIAAPVLSFVLPGLPDPRLSPNGWDRMGLWQQVKARKEQRDLYLNVLWYELGIRPVEPLERPVELRIRFTGCGNRADASNWCLHRGIKVLLDCLTLPKGPKDYGIGLLVGDETKWVRGVSVTVDANGPKETTVEILEV